MASDLHCCLAMGHSTHKRGMLLLPSLVALVVPWVARADEVTLEDFAGDYEFSGGDEERARLDAAIDEVVSAMVPLTRRIARNRIRAEVRVDERVRIETPGDDQVRIAFPQWETPPLPLGGEPVRGRGRDRRAARMSAELDGERLVFDMHTGRGRLENWFTLSPDRQHLFMQVRITSDRLPAAIRYTLSYRRS